MQEPEIKAGQVWQDYAGRRYEVKALAEPYGGLWSKLGPMALLQECNVSPSRWQWVFPVQMQNLMTLQQGDG